MEVYDMKKIKSNNKQKQKAPMKSGTKITLYSIAGIILLAIIALVAIEGTPGRITVKNTSDVKLEYVHAYFRDSEDTFSEDIMSFDNLEKGDKSELPLERINLLYTQANLEVRFKFEGYDEMFVDAGYFNDIFSGKIYISFENTDNDKVLLKIKASAGLLPSPHIICDEEHIINLAEGYIEE
jgi:hypothetical protein